ncbi:MAG: hypothetical protein K6F20_03825 [Bacteroidaceae bacterium]|nr:hypothetical protein [Bacteroidaceae bacterium]
MNTTTEQRRQYERPRSTVVELQQASQMMQASKGTKATRSSYGAATPFNWD